MKTILFQGDSITDSQRIKDDLGDMGKGYARFVNADLGFEFPNEYKFINKGVSGNTVVGVYSRIKKDILNIKPDYMSILIGVNDVWHEVKFQDGVDNEKYEKIYTMLIEEILEELPDLKIMIMEPYVLKGTATEENWDYFEKEVALRAESAKRIAEKFNLKFVKLQDKFDEMTLKTNNPAYWAYDGVHPSIEGHRLIANEWKKAFAQIK